MAFQDRLRKKLGGLRTFWQEEQSLRARLTGIAHLLTGNFLGAIIGLVGFALTARALGPHEYGLLALFFSYTRAIERLVSFQGWQPLIKYGAGLKEHQQKDDYKSLLKFGLLLDFSSTSLAWLVAVAIALTATPLIGISPDNTALLVMFCTVLLFQWSGMPTAALRLSGRFRMIAYSQLVSAAISGLLCLCGYLLGAGLFGFLLIWMVSQIASSLILVGLAFQVLRKQGVTGILAAPLKGVRERFPGIWSFAWTANLSLTIRSSANEVDTLLVGLLADPVAAGLYHIAKRIGRIAQQAGVQVQAVLYPDLARAWAAKAIAEFRRAIVQIEALLIGFGIIVYILLALFIEPLLRWTAGPEFLGAAPLVMVQTIAVIMTLSGAVMRSALLSMGLEKRVLRSVIAATLCFHATAFALIPLIGAMGANIAHIVMATVWGGSMWIWYRRALGEVAAARDQAAPN